MKHVNLLVLALAVLRFSGSAVAQHGQGVGGGMGAAKHGRMNDASNTPQHKTVSDRLAQNSKLSDKLQTLTGMPAQQACSRFNE